MDELVSVVVPVYNVEKYLDKCVNSIVNQTYSNLEIILVDDGSLDKSGTMCDQWAMKDQRIRVIHKENAGPGIARNAGIDSATGKYIFFFDSDDYVDINLIEKCIFCSRNSGAQVVLYGRINTYNDDKMVHKAVSNKKLVYSGDAVVQELLPTLFTYELGLGTGPWGKMYALEIIKSRNLRFLSQKEIISEDAYFMLELFGFVSCVAIVPECLYYYCIRTSSYSRGYRADRQLRNDEFLNCCIQFVEESGLPSKIIFHIKSRYHGLTMGTLMQIMRSDLQASEKKQEIMKVLKNQTLQDTLENAVLALDAKSPRLLWKCLRQRRYKLCMLLLYLNLYL